MASCPPGSVMRNGRCTPQRSISRTRRANPRKRNRARQNGMNGCPPGMHMMPDGTCMAGDYHGASPGQNGGGYRKRRPASRRRVNRRRTSIARNKKVNRRVKRRPNIRRSNNRMSLKRIRARQQGNPIISGNTTYMCPPGTTTVTSDCTAHRRR